MVLRTSWVKEISCLAFFNIGMFTIVLLSIFLTLLFSLFLSCSRARQV
jgi:hypothetical protein